MANDVFANGREISCKAADGKSICAFPDVCFTPPENPATPPGVPIPYPNTGMAKDTTSGSKSVKITGKEVMLKNKSYFKKSTGDEAGSAAKKGVVTSTNRGKVYFTSWSMDVKVEGENVVRHLDLTTHNHMSSPPNTPPWFHTDEMFFGDFAKCEKEVGDAREACGGDRDGGKNLQKEPNCSEDCREKMGCILVPKGKDKKYCCPEENTGDHMIEDHMVRHKPAGEKRKVPMPDFAHIADMPGGAYRGAPTACVDGGRYKKRHGIGHAVRGARENAHIGQDLDYATAKEWALEGHAQQFPNAGCSKPCLEAQLDAFYGEDGSKGCDTPRRKQSLTDDQKEYV